MDPSVITILIVIVSIIVFLVTREFWCWYWKINEIKDLLHSIDQKLTVNNLSTNEKQEGSKNKTSFNNLDNETRTCPFCSETVKKTALVCRFCGKDLKKYDEDALQQKKEKYKDIQEFLKDEKIYSEAKELRRIYSKKMAVDYLKNEASEFGINCEEITEDCIDDLLGLN